MKKLLIVDCGNLVYRNVHAAVASDPDDNYSFKLWKSMFLSDFLNTIAKIQPDRVVLAEETQDNWRKDIYPEYKLDRAAKRAKSKVNFDRFFPIMDSFLTDIKRTFSNIICLQVDRCEGDDIIGTICLRSESTRNTIISTDGDFAQLINMNTNQFNPQKKLYVECLNPARALKVKVVMGDRNDYITAIRPKVGPKTASKLITEGLQDLLDNDEEVRKIYERNEKLVDLTKIPEVYSNEIWKQYTEYDVKEIKPGSIFSFFMKNGLNKLLDEFNSMEATIKGLR